jgi:hypothetical protein
MKPIHTFKFKDNDSIWYSVKGKECRITAFDFDEEQSLLVYHNLNWKVYTSTQFEQEVLMLVKKANPNIVDVEFSEQGLQRNGIAHMDVTYDRKNNSKNIW